MIDPPPHAVMVPPEMIHAYLEMKSRRFVSRVARLQTEPGPPVRVDYRILARPSVSSRLQLTAGVGPF